MTTSIVPPNPDRPAAQSVEPADADLLDRVGRLADEVLWPAAASVDVADAIPAGHLSALADLGLYAMAVGASGGGLGLAPATVRAVVRRLASGCGATTFAFAQHLGTSGIVAGSPNQDLRHRWLPDLVDRSLAGIAYAHVRRPGPPALSARRHDDGWLLDGAAPWVTSWGTAEVLGVAASVVDPASGQMLWALVPASEQPGLRAGRRFELMVFQATSTVALEFDRYRVDPDEVVDVVDFAAWSTGDRLLASRPNPACLGIGDRVLTLLADRDSGLAERFQPWWHDVSERAEAASASVDRALASRAAGSQAADPEPVDPASVAAMRAETVEAVQRLSTALLSAVAGAGIERSHPAQRLAREALFYVVQAQNADGRAAMGEWLTPTGPER